jgi:hypothetical protein
VGGASGRVILGSWGSEMLYNPLSFYTASQNAL